MTDTPGWVAEATVADAPRTTRSPVLFIVFGALAVAALAANVWGGLNFPSNAPVEQVICFGLVVDMVAVIILAVIGVIVARQPLAVRPSSRLAVVGLVLGAVSLGATIAAAWVPSALALIDGFRLHYSDETFVVFVIAPVWITGLAFSGFAYRRGGEARNNVYCVLGLAFGAIVFVAAAAASVIYGLGLST